MQANIGSLDDVYPIYRGLLNTFAALDQSHLPPPAFSSDYSSLTETILKRMAKLNMEGILRFVCALHRKHRDVILQDHEALNEAIK